MASPEKLKWKLSRVKTQRNLCDVLSDNTNTNKRQKRTTRKTSRPTETTANSILHEFRHLLSVPLQIRHYENIGFLDTGVVRSALSENQLR